MSLEPLCGSSSENPPLSLTLDHGQAAYVARRLVLFAAHYSGSVCTAEHAGLALIPALRHLFRQGGSGDPARPLCAKLRRSPGAGTSDERKTAADDRVRAPGSGPRDSRRVEHPVAADDPTG